MAVLLRVLQHIALASDGEHHDARTDPHEIDAS